MAVEPAAANGIDWSSPDPPPMYEGARGPERASTSVPSNGHIVVSFEGASVSIDVSSALTVVDVERHLRTIFRLKKDASTLLRRADNNAVVVPGPGMPSGAYVLERIHTPWMTAYLNLRDHHYPKLKTHVHEKAVPHIVSASKEHGARFHSAVMEATRQTSLGLAEAGTQLGKHVEVAKVHISAGLAKAGEASKSRLAKLDEGVRRQAQKMTQAASTHARENSGTWTAKMWHGAVGVAPERVASYTGVPVEHLLPQSSSDSVASMYSSIPAQTPAPGTETIPVSTAAGVPGEAQKLPSDTMTFPAEPTKPYMYQDDLQKGDLSGTMASGPPPGPESAVSDFLQKIGTDNSMPSYEPVKMQAEPKQNKLFGLF
eukprot:TRINITY_DN27054_c0_g1_i1.p1 TRINITY_DN27054_c0_g1~~TRINITY_DN27054_c0_g1_i1.p1  ORF type:complete len:372 (+),score=66.23 TRINITY_DN27054_c0_g1_i1:129-1244(+)